MRSTEAKRPKQSWSTSRVSAPWREFMELSLSRSIILERSRHTSQSKNGIGRKRARQTHQLSWRKCVALAMKEPSGPLEGTIPGGRRPSSGNRQRHQRTKPRSRLQDFEECTAAGCARSRGASVRGGEQQSHRLARRQHHAPTLSRIHRCSDTAWLDSHSSTAGYWRRR